MLKITCLNNSNIQSFKGVIKDNFYLPGSIQKTINWFGFFLAFPFIDLIGNSITFYIFLLILFKVNRLKSFLWTRRFSGVNLFWLFLLITFLSLVFSPPMERAPGFFNDLKVFIQYTYWIFIGIFFTKYYSRIKLSIFYKYIFIGTLLNIVCYYFIPFHMDFELGSLTLKMSRNGFIFNLLCTIPLCFYAIYRKWQTKGVILFSLLFIYAILSSNGRSGSIIILIQTLGVFLILLSRLRILLKVSMLVLTVSFGIMQIDKFEPYIEATADYVEQFNPRFASLIRGEGDTEGDLDFDKSWLERKLHVDKAIEMFLDYPLLGVGANHYVFYDTELETLRQYDRLNQTAEVYNRRSAHNSYVQILSEMGILGITFLSLLLFIPLSFLFTKVLIQNSYSIYQLPLISLLGISIHFYAISALTGAIPWLIIGLSWGAISNKISK